MNYCPAGVPPSQMNTETMWFIYGLIAMVTPLGLWLAKKWMLQGFKTKLRDREAYKNAYFGIMDVMEYW